MQPREGPREPGADQEQAQHEGTVDHDETHHAAQVMQPLRGGLGEAAAAVGLALRLHQGFGLQALRAAEDMKAQHIEIGTGSHGQHGRHFLGIDAEHRSHRLCVSLAIVSNRSNKVSNLQL